jgi:hypothetical protein
MTEIIAFPGCASRSASPRPAASPWPTLRGPRPLTPEQRARRSALSKRPRRSKHGTPEERAAKAAALADASAVTALPMQAPDEPDDVAKISRSAPVGRTFKSSKDHHEVIVRAAKIVSWLRERGNGYFNNRRAALFLKNLCQFNPNDGDDPKFLQVLEWVKDQGQSHDWIFDGDPSVMICRLAATRGAPAKRARPRPALVVVPSDPPGAA